MIHIPLTPRYLVSILPEEELSLRNCFNRVAYGDDAVMGINYDIEKHHERFILGSKESLELYLRESSAYNEPVAEDHPKLVKMSRLASAVSNLVELLVRNNGIVTKELGPLDFYLKKYVIRQAITNDARSQIPGLNSKTGLGTALSLDVDESLCVSDKAFANPMADDDDKIIRTINEREINGDDVVEQIYLAVYDEDFGIKDRAEICEAFGIKYSDFDNGTQRFKNVLRKVYLKEI